MPDDSAKNIVRMALSNNELHKVLLGESGYCYLPKWSPSSTNTDITVMWDALHDLASEYTLDDLSSMISEAINKIQFKYEGIYPIASIILQESYRKNKRENTFLLPLSDIAISLKLTIENHRDKLKSDKRGEGAGYQDGLFGDLVRLNQNTIELGGPDFI